jgi:RNA polymerase primary sigma factor
VNLQPLGDRLILRAVEEDETTASGIVLPDTAREKPLKGRVARRGLRPDRVLGYAPGGRLGASTSGAAPTRRGSPFGEAIMASPQLDGRAIRRHDEELVLAAQRGGPEARAALVDAFMPHIASIARLYRGTPAVGREELMQDGVVGLLRALERFDISLGTPFWAYAAWWVRQAMQQLVSELTRPVVLSDRAMRQLARVRSAERDRMQADGRVPTLREIASDAGLTRGQVELLVAASRTARTLDEPIGGEESGATFGDLISDPRAEDAYERVPTQAQVGELEQLLNGLDERERMIMRARFGLDGPERTLREVALALGVCAERVRQIEDRALDKLREAVGG